MEISQVNKMPEVQNNTLKVTLVHMLVGLVIHSHGVLLYQI